MVLEVNENEFKEKLTEKCVVDFYATWCPPCKMLAPVLEKVSAEYEGKVNFLKVNVDENPNIAREYSVMSVPTLIVFEDGEVINRKSGYMGEQELIALIENK